MAGLSESRPNAVTGLMACGLAAIVGVMSDPIAAPGLILPRMLFAAALVCLWMDTVVATRILAPERQLSNPDRWVLAGQYAWYFGGFLFIATWQGAGDPVPNAIGAGVAGALYGGIMALVLKGPKESPSAEARFDLDRPITQTPLGRLLYRLWPGLMAVLLAVGLAFAPGGGWDPRALYFLVAFSASVMTAYRPTPGLGPWRSAWVPRSLGLVLLVAGLFLPV